MNKKLIVAAVSAAVMAVMAPVASGQQPYPEPYPLTTTTDEKNDH